MRSFRNLVIRVDLQSGIIIGAGDNDTDATNGLFNTDGPIVLSQRPLIDEVFCKLLTAIYGGQGSIELKTSASDPSVIVRDESFPLPCIQHHVSSAMSAAGTDPNTTAMSMIRTILANIPDTPHDPVKLERETSQRSVTHAKKRASKKAASRKAAAKKAGSSE